MKRILAMIVTLIVTMTALFAVASPASAGTYIHRTDQMTFVNQTCNVGYGEAVSGKHLWVCTDLWAIETYDGFTEGIEGVGHLYCFLNGSNSSQVPCASFAGNASVYGDNRTGNTLIVGGGSVSCGTGSGHGPCSGNGITETVWAYSNYRCAGIDGYAAHYGKLGTLAEFSSAVDGRASINGTVASVQQFWGRSSEICFD